MHCYQRKTRLLMLDNDGNSKCMHGGNINWYVPGSGRATLLEWSNFIGEF